MLSLFHGFLSDEILIKSINKRIVRTAASKALWVDVLFMVANTKFWEI